MPISNPVFKSPSTGTQATGKAGGTNYTNGPNMRGVVINLSPAAGGLTSVTITPSGGASYVVDGSTSQGVFTIPPFATYNFAAGTGTILRWSEYDY